MDGGEGTELLFTPTSYGDDGKSDPGAVNTNVGNLVIADVSTYIAIFTAKDDLADTYRDHRNKDMFAVNWRKSMVPFNIWKDGYSWDHLSSYAIGWTTIKNYFRNIGLPLRMWAGSVGPNGSPTAGATKTHLDQGWNVTYKPLSKTQQQIEGRTVIVVEFLSRSVQGGGLDGVVGEFQYMKNWNLPPSKPGLAVINTEGIELIYKSSLSNAQMQWLMTNVILHELTHSVIGTQHCGKWTDNISKKHCVIYSPVNSYFYTDLKNYNIFAYKNKTYPTPWHSLNEINAMREQLNLNKY